jgi:hypothetical protein
MRDPGREQSETTTATGTIMLPRLEYAPPIRSLVRVAARLPALRAGHRRGDSTQLMFRLAFWLATACASRYVSPFDTSGCVLRRAGAQSDPGQRPSEHGGTHRE